MERTGNRGRRGRRRQRGGYTLVFFAMILFAILALAALVIDIGFARLTQRQMQIAADGGAVEGLRGEGTVPYVERLDAARELTQWHFDDDLNSSGNFPLDDDGAFDAGTGQLGAGPLVQFSGSEGDPSLAASQFMVTDPNNPVFKPVLVGGSPTGAGQFEVALRRGPTDTPAADLYVNGPAVPYLFARGSLMNRQQLATGMTVRGTGLAEATPAQSIGFANDTITPALPGLTQLTLELSYWNNLTTSVADAQSVSAGEIGAVGRFFSLGPAANMPLTLGRSIPTADVLSDGNYAGYVPIYTNLTSTSTQRVVGYGQVQFVVSGGGTSVSITRQPASIGLANVSGVPCYSADMSSVEASELLALVANIEEPLLAPVSRNHAP